MSVTFADLVAPLSEAEGLRVLHRRELLLLRGHGEPRFRSLVDWNTILDVAAGPYPAKRLQITRKGEEIPRLFFSDHGHVSRSKLDGAMEQGASLIMRSLEDFVPAVADLETAVTALTHERVRCSAVVSTGHGGALRKHFDAQDIVVIQVEGSKRWLVSTSPVEDPVPGMRGLPEPSDGLALDETLESGDVLFLPGGYWHRCENGAGRSIHVAILIEPLCPQLIVASLAEQLRTDPAARRPLGRNRDQSGEHDEESALKAALIAYINALSLQEQFALHRDRPWARSGERY